MYCKLFNSLDYVSINCYSSVQKNIKYRSLGLSFGDFVEKIAQMLTRAQ